MGTPDTGPATPNVSLLQRTGWEENGTWVLHLRRFQEAAPSGVAVEGVSERILAMLMNEAADAVFGKSDPRRPLIWPCKKASITPKDLLAWADEWGVQEVINVLESLRQRYGEERYRVSPLLRDMARTKQTFFS